MIFWRLNPVLTGYNLRVRRLITSLACFAFALSLHASIPGNATAKFDSSGNFARPVQPSEPLSLTAIPADRQSFYLEFYGTEQLPSQAERKPSLFHRLASVIKKTAQRVIPN